MYEIYNNQGLFNAHHKPKLWKKLQGFGFIEITYPIGYEFGRLFATQAAEDWFMAEKAKLETEENQSFD